jgi:hypothetical protein
MVALAAIVTACHRQAEPSPSSPEAHAIYREGRAIQAALGTGINYAEFGGMVRELATDVKLFGDRVQIDKTMDRDALTIIKSQDLLQAYVDSLTVWDMELRGGEDDSEELRTIAKRHGAAGNLDWGDPFAGKKVNYKKIRAAAWRTADSIQTELIILIEAPKQ